MFGLETYDWRPIAAYPKTNEDGQPCELDECAMPAKFWRVRALPSKDSIGGTVLPFTLSTGSGEEMHHLCEKIAEAVAGGMLAMDKTDT